MGKAEIQPIAGGIVPVEPVREGWWHRLQAWVGRISMGLTVVVLLLLMLFFAIGSRMVKTLRAGELGVMFQPLEEGTDTDHVYGEGVHVLWPWDEMVVYDARAQMVVDTVSALSKDGLRVGVEYSAQFMPNRNSLGRLHRYVGPDYVSKIVIPEVSTALREVVGQYKPEELYFSDRSEIQSQVLHKVRQKGAEKYVTFVDVMILNIDLPDRIEKAIEGKLEQEQLYESYTHRLASEQEEAQRKRIEAEGIRDFEKVSGISILKWRGLEATEKLAQSPNTKVVMVGRGEDELPVIMGEGK